MFSVSYENMDKAIFQQSDTQLRHIVAESETVKCVVVGDSGVGKTRLVCSQARGTKYSLEQLIQTHIPTVWALDHYQNNIHVLRRSIRKVDGITVSLRLWDTFGYHDKDKHFAYGRADVILVCFSVVRRRSYNNILSHWYPEIQRTCPGVPIILCGCKIDLRHLYLEDYFMQMDKGPFFKAITDDDILYAKDGRKLCEDIKAEGYYETSVLRQFGIAEVFDNVIRAALIYKRNKRFWNVLNVFRTLNKPFIQKPYCPPQPKLPKFSRKSNDPSIDLESLLKVTTDSTDVVIRCQSVDISLHKLILIGSSEFFENLFLLDLNASNNLDNPLFPFVEVQKKHESDSLQDAKYILHAHPAFTAATLTCSVEFLYTGRMQNTNSNHLQIAEVGQLIKCQEMVFYVRHILDNESYLNDELTKLFLEKQRKRIQLLYINHQLLSDILFQLDDGVVAAHKLLLTIRCEVMAGMFSCNFIERSAKTIPLPGVSRSTFVALQEYLYTGSNPCMKDVELLEFLEVANRFCLPVLLSMIECQIVEEMEIILNRYVKKDVNEKVLNLFEFAQMHNADQLVSWCSRYIQVNYSDILAKNGKRLFALQPEIIAELEKRQWPPAWYQEEIQFYERRKKDGIMISEPPTSWEEDKNPGCLGFCTKRR
ncbi:DgyrCDS5445 [Dimorphilus gyrociliatus]|uniref:DgyrCDS5445 n=1 Tax=Dimorphilus gyrociliatus TaxID=2664684 RepID=A0A7I8VJW2_9ANNE|nr:DgyrCDS5445 [Dimorphilus gyrociliatus]